MQISYAATQMMEDSGVREEVRGLGAAAFQAYSKEPRQMLPSNSVSALPILVTEAYGSVEERVAEAV